MKRLALAVASAALALAACGSSVESGVVVDKRDKPAHVEWQCGIGPKGGCVLMPVGIPEMWQLRLRDGDGDEGWVDVTSADYARTNVGDNYGGAS